MVQVFAPKPLDSQLPMFFNIDSSVGKNGQNNSTDDIGFVQFCLKTIGTDTQTPGLQAPLLKVEPTGRMTQQTIEAIEAFQAASRTKADGRVSVARGYKSGGSFFTIVLLNFGVKFRFAQKWPNVDDIPGCPGLIRLACRRAMVGTRGA